MQVWQDIYYIYQGICGLRTDSLTSFSRGSASVCAGEGKWFLPARYFSFRFLRAFAILFQIYIDEIVTEIVFLYPPVIDCRGESISALEEGKSSAWFKVTIETRSPSVVLRVLLASIERFPRIILSFYFSDKFGSKIAIGIGIKSL